MGRRKEGGQGKEGGKKEKHERRERLEKSSKMRHAGSKPPQIKEQRKHSIY